MGKLKSPTGPPRNLKSPMGNFRELLDIYRGLFSTNLVALGRDSPATTGQVISPNSTITSLGWLGESLGEVVLLIEDRLLSL